MNMWKLLDGEPVCLNGLYFWRAKRYGEVEVLL